MAAILFVKVKSDLGFEELERRISKRRAKLYEVPGLIQKIYARDPSTGELCGIYFFVDRQALENFGETELARTIPIAYEATEIRREVLDVLYPLYPDRGPIMDNL